MELAIGSTIYSCTFFKEICADESFHIPEHYQHDLLYLTATPRTFLYQRVSVFLLHGLSF